MIEVPYGAVRKVTNLAVGDRVLVSTSHLTDPEAYSLSCENEPFLDQHSFIAKVKSANISRDDFTNGWINLVLEPTGDIGAVQEYGFHLPVGEFRIWNLEPSSKVLIPCRIEVDGVPKEWHRHNAYEKRQAITCAGVEAARRIEINIAEPVLAG